MGYIFLSCWAVGSHTLYPHKLYPIATVLGFSPELNGKTLILRTTHLTDRTWRNLASTTLDASYLLAGLQSVVKVLCKLPGDKSNHQFHLAVKTITKTVSKYWPNKIHRRHNSGTDVIGQITHFLIGFKA